MNSESLAVLSAAGAVWMDLRFAKVKNEWIAVCIAAALTARWLEGGWTGMVNGLAGALAALVLTGWLFLFRMLGAGDIKLLTVLGLFLGPEKLLSCLWLALLFGAAQAVCILTKKHLWKERISYFLEYFEAEKYRLQKGSGLFPQPYRKGSVERPENIHFTIPVLLSTFWICFGGVL